MRLHISLVQTVFVLVTAFGATSGQSPDQTKCTLAVDQSPSIRTIKLGMTAEQVLAFFPGSSEAPMIKNAISAGQRHPNFGLVSLYFQPITYPSAAMERFAGIEGISITLFDGRVIAMGVGYKGVNSYPRGPAWPTVDNFIEKISEAFALPRAKDWVQRNESLKFLNCNGFVLEAWITDRTGSINVRNSAIAYQDTVKQRAAANEERLRREFKP